MKSSYIDYSMSVIVSRALPDVRDGFKPVHRRILFGMMGLGNTSDKPYKKSARVVGEVLGKYHPHGDSSVYGALVRMAQPWAMRYMLVDGQGNYGSVDGDSAAAMRYTECRLRKIGEDMMTDLEKETVDMQNNFDDSLQEPTVMPARIPNLLVNGASGIAVGMATNMPTHNLSEVIDACIAYIENNDIDIEELMTYVKAPDFPTGGYIYGMSGVREAYLTGRGRVIMRARAEIETGSTHDKIVVTEIPYGVNKAELIKNIADLANEKKIEGIANANDESDREGMRIVIDVKRDANASVVLNKLYKMTMLQTSFGVNNVALVHGRPRLLNLKDLIKYFVEHRHDVVIRRTQYDLRKAKERAHILEGLIIASDNIDEVIKIIRAAKTPNDAISGLMERFQLSEIQSRAIVEMRLRQLTGLMQDQLHAEYEEIQKQIAYLEEILVNDELCRKVIKDELLEIFERLCQMPRFTLSIIKEFGNLILLNKEVAERLFNHFERLNPDQLENNIVISYLKSLYKNNHEQYIDACEDILRFVMNDVLTFANHDLQKEIGNRILEIEGYDLLIDLFSKDYNTFLFVCFPISTFPPEYKEIMRLELEKAIRFYAARMNHDEYRLTSFEQVANINRLLMEEYKEEYSNGKE